MGSIVNHWKRKNPNRNIINLTGKTSEKWIEAMPLYYRIGSFGTMCLECLLHGCFLAWASISLAFAGLSFLPPLKQWNGIVSLWWRSHWNSFRFIWVRWIFFADCRRSSRSRQLVWILSYVTANYIRILFFTFYFVLSCSGRGAGYIEVGQKHEKNSENRTMQMILVQVGELRRYTAIFTIYVSMLNVALVLNNKVKCLYRVIGS